MKTVEYKYDVGDQVYIRDTSDIHGRVTGMCTRVWGATYCVCWWQDGRRYDEWLHDWEIESQEERKHR